MKNRVNAKQQPKRIGLKSTLVLASLAMTISPAMAKTDWWKMSDKEFAETYADQALSNDITSQSKVAWMLFARLNEQVPSTGSSVSKWEMWPSNADTFSPGRAKFALNNKIRTRPHFGTTKAELLLRHFKNTPSSAGEERTRNMISYDYIRSNGLYTKVGVNKFLSSGKKADFPIGATEIKAFWAHGKTSGAYVYFDEAQGVHYSLLGLHIMCKFKPAPKDPFTSEDPSWFWTTFEFKGNEGLTHAQSLLTYNDKLSVDQATALLTEAGLGSTAFVNYRSNGTQIRFTDKSNPKSILMGNTKMEAFAATPQNTPPSQWTSWQTSCHTCHGSTAAKVSGQSVEFYPFRPIIVGKLTEANAPGLSEYSSLDFVWSIAFNAQ